MGRGWGLQQLFQATLFGLQMSVVTSQGELTLVTSPGSVFRI